VSTANCPTRLAGWTRSGDGCYYIIPNNEADRDTAVSLCLSNSATLVSINNVQENNDVKNLM